MRRILLLLAGFFLWAFPAKAQDFWSTLEQVLTTGCNYTSQFNVGPNWDWICTLQGTYRNIRNLIEDGPGYARDFAFNIMYGFIEAYAQSLGYTIGGGLNAFAEQLDQYIKDIRRAPQKIRNLLVKAALEEVKKKYAPSTEYVPPNSLWELFEEYQGNSVGLAAARFNEAVRELIQRERESTLATGLALQAETLKDTPEPIKSATQMNTKVLTPKEVEQKTNGGIKKGIADDLIDRAKSAASMREVSEIIVEALATLLKLQAVNDTALLTHLSNMAQQDLLSNSGLNSIYNELAEESKREADAAELALIESFRAFQETAEEVASAIDQVVDTLSLDNLLIDFSSISDPF